MRTRWIRRLPTPLPARLDSSDFPNCFAVRRSTFESLEGFDALRFPGAFSEADLGARLAANGGRIFCVPGAGTRHDIGKEAWRRFHLKSVQDAYDYGRSRRVFTRRHGTALQRWTYGIVGQWLYAAAYLNAMRGIDPDIRRRAMRAYLCGMAGAEPPLT